MYLGGELARYPHSLRIVFLTIVAPIWIFAHYFTAWRRSRGLSSADEKALAELWESTRRIEARLGNLERLLDAETPGWRPPGAAAEAGAAPDPAWNNIAGRGAR